MTTVASPPEPPAAGAAPALGAAPVVASTLPSARSDLAIDLVLLGATGVIALTGFGSTFGGVQYLLVGCAGLATAATIATLAAARSVNLWLVAVATVAAYFLVGGPLVVPDLTVAGFVPTLDSMAALAEVAVRGWVNLVTTLPPVGDSQHLLALPLICGVTCGAVSFSIARRARSAVVVALLPSLVVIVVAILTGTASPAWVLQATAWTAAALVWAATRQRSARTAGLSSQRSSRLGGMAAVLLAASAVGYGAAQLPFVSGSNERFILRDVVEPPFDLREFASPLAAFRSYTKDRRDEVLFTVDGLDDGDLLRLATLDTYDGVVWHVSEASEGDGSNSFVRVGSELPLDESPNRTVEVEVVGQRGPWVPVAGDVGSVEWGGPRASMFDEELRVNLATGTFAVPPELTNGDRYVARSHVGSVSTDEITDGRPDPEVVVPAPVTRPTGESAGADRMARFMVENTAGAASKWDQVLRLEEALREQGYLSHGREGEPPSRAGHSLERLSSMFLSEQSMVGDEEQYAAVMALFASEVGFPSRVVVGFAPDAAGDVVEVKGADITAWAEIAVAGHGWVPLLDAVPTRTELEEEQSKPEPPPDRLVEPPVTPPTTLATSGSAGESTTVDNCTTDCDSGSAGFEIPTWAKVGGVVLGLPLLLITVLTATMAGLKARRRSHRRQRGTPSQRVAHGWAEVCDLARDLGDVTPTLATRRETAVVLGRPGVADLARSADTLVFGPFDIDPQVIDHYWSEVDLTRKAMLGPLGRVDRWKALVNPTSLRMARSARRQKSVARRGAATRRGVARLKVRRGALGAVPS